MMLFSAADGPHISLKAEPVFEIAGFTVTNSMLYGLLIAITIIVILLSVAKKSNIKPVGGLLQFFEIIVDFLMGMLEDTLGSRAKAVKYAPIFASFFIFIMMTNLLGLLPVVGSGFTVGEGTLFRPFTADLNGTLGLSIVAIITVQYLSIKESGFLGHLKHYFTDQPWNPINFFIGILEIIGEFIRILSLSLRLFLNTAIGEALIAIFAFIGQSGTSFTILPIIMFEMLVAFIQAYVFTILCATYLGLAISHGHHEHDDHDTEDVHQASPKLSPSEAA